MSIVWCTLVRGQMGRPRARGNVHFSIESEYGLDREGNESRDYGQSSGAENENHAG